MHVAYINITVFYTQTYNLDQICIPEAHHTDCNLIPWEEVEGQTKVSYLE